jgi:GNAT superfamily N-acetyltransferase
MTMNDGEFSLLIGYKDVEPLRYSFNTLARKTFGIDFERWYRSGYWTKQYIPYSLAREGQVVANVSVSFMPVNIDGAPMTMAQIGTVMTDPDFRGRGLSRILMKTVLEEWAPKVDEVYLFANDEVLGFYPKFGFRESAETCASVAVRASGPARAEKLDMDSAENPARVERAVRGTRGVSRLRVNNAGLVMFHLTGPSRENVYFDPRTNAIIVAEVEGENMRIEDVFCEDAVNLDDLICAFGEGVTRATFGFSPIQDERIERTRSAEEGSTLFVLKNAVNFSEKGLMFPVLSRA